MAQDFNASEYDKHYEENFEFPLWNLIKQRAEQKDISYAAAIDEVVPEYIKTIRYRDETYENECINKRREEFATLAKQKPR
jgi:hypothetical protein